MLSNDQEMVNVKSYLETPKTIAQNSETQIQFTCAFVSLTLSVIFVVNAKPDTSDQTENHVPETQLTVRSVENLAYVTMGSMERVSDFEKTLN